MLQENRLTKRKKLELLKKMYFALLFKLNEVISYQIEISDLNGLEVCPNWIINTFKHHL